MIVKTIKKAINIPKKKTAKSSAWSVKIASKVANNTIFFLQSTLFNAPLLNTLF
ncbi:MAG: hypothetical protein ACOX0B_00025 [Minisyncoccales bacterium]